jgi:hypothetical protein
MVRGRFRSLFGLRSSTALLAGALAPWLVVAQMIPPVASLLLVLVLFFGELVDRHLFFRVVDAPKMPGLPA